MSANQCNFNFPLLLSWGSISSPQRCDSTWCRHVVACALSGTTNTVEKNCYDHTTALTDDAPSVSDVGFCQKKKKDNLQNNVAFRSVDVSPLQCSSTSTRGWGACNFCFYSYAPEEAAFAAAAAMAFPPRRRPVLLAAIRPTFCPGGASLRTVEGCPICW